MDCWSRLEAFRRNAVLALMLLIAGGALAAAAAESPAPPDPWTIEVSTDRAEALYACGETARFRVVVQRDGQAPGPIGATVTLTLDGGRVLSSEALDIASGAASVAGTLHEPGFLRCSLSLDTGTERRQALAAAGFEPERIRKAAAEPPDFELFWDEGRRRLAAIPPDLRLTRLEAQCSATVDVFAVSLANLEGTRVYGFLCVPCGRPGPFPAWVTVPGAGPGPFGPAGREYAERGALALTVGVHTWDSGSSSQEAIEAAYAELNRERTYAHQGAPDREAYYFRRAFLGIDRAITWLMARPDFDGQHLVLDGSSQGGASALILAGLNARVTAAAANVPALCDHGAHLLGRAPGWPHLVQGATEEEKLRRLEMAAYFDAAHFARRIAVPTIVSVGFIDQTCPPSSVYAAFNEIPGPKRIIHGPRHGHEWNVGTYREFCTAWVAGQLGLAPALPPSSPAETRPAAGPASSALPAPAP